MRVNIINKYDDKIYNEVIEKVLKNGLNILSKSDYGINIILVGTAEITELNELYREKLNETDVLTFPDGYLNNLGDVFISVPQCELQASELGHSFNRELGFLVAHGFLHSLGYDHLTEDEEKQMTNLQEQILNKAKLYR